MKDSKFYITFIFFIGFIFALLYGEVLDGSFIFASGDYLNPLSLLKGIESSEARFSDRPIWLPWIFSGMPSVHAFNDLSRLYFPNLIFEYINKAGVPEFWNLIFHLFFGMMGCVVLSQKLKMSKYIALFSASCFVLLPYLHVMGVHGHGSQLMSSVYIPWIFWSIIRFKEKTSFSNLFTISMFVGLQLLRAHIQIAYYTWCFIGLYVVFEFIFSRDRKSKFFFGFLASFVIGFLMSLSIYLPVINYTPFSIRSSHLGGAGIEYATNWSMTVFEYITFILPSFYGFGGQLYSGGMPFTDYPNYSGILVLLLAIYSIFSSKGNKLKYFLLTICILSFLLSLGKNFISFYSFFYSWLPYFNKLRVPVMIVLLLNFSLLILASLGLKDLVEGIGKSSDYLFDRFNKLNLYLIISLIAICTLFGLYFNHQGSEVVKSMIFNDIIFLSSTIVISLILIILAVKKFISIKVFSVSIILLTVVDLYRINYMIIYPSRSSLRSSSLVSQNSVDRVFKENKIIKFLKKDSSKFRVLQLSNKIPNFLAAFELESIGGYHPAKLSVISNAERNIQWMEALESNGQFDQGLKYFSGLLKMLNVKYILKKTPSLSESLEFIIFDKRTKNYLYKFKEFSDRVYFPKKVEKIERDLIDEKIYFHPEKEFHQYDPYEVVYSNISKIKGNEDRSMAKIKSWTPNRIEISVEAEKENFLVLSEIFYPKGWSVTSHPNIEILLVNNMLRGFIVPEGSYTLVLEFSPLDLELGSIMSNIIFYLIFVFFVIKIFYKKNDS